MRFNTQELAKSAANELVTKYGQNKTVEDVIDAAIADNYFENDTELLAVWARLLRILPRKVGA